MHAPDTGPYADAWVGTVVSSRSRAVRSNTHPLVLDKGMMQDVNTVGRASELRACRKRMRGPGDVLRWREDVSSLGLGMCCVGN
jgi:hypothetical protein